MYRKLDPHFYYIGILDGTRGLPRDGCQSNRGVQGCQISKFMVDKGSRENGRLLDQILDLLGSVAGENGKISMTKRRSHDNVSYDYTFCNWTPHCLRSCMLRPHQEMGTNVV